MITTRYSRRMDHAADAIIQQWGAFGAVFVLILVPMGAYIRWLSNRLNEVQAQRVSDAVEVRNTLLGVTKEFSESFREYVRASTELKGVLERVENVIERLETRIGTLEDTVKDGARGHGGRMGRS